MATGDTMNIFTALNNVPPTTNFASLGFRNRHAVLEFDGATNESAVFEGILPNHYNGGGLTVYIHWACAGTSGDVDWDGQIERVNDAFDLDADSFAAVQSVDNTAVPGNSGVLDVVSIAFTSGAQMDSLTAGEAYRLKITRDAVSDTNTNNALITRVEVTET